MEMVSNLKSYARIKLEEFPFNEGQNVRVIGEVSYSTGECGECSMALNGGNITLVQEDICLQPVESATKFEIKGVVQSDNRLFVTGYKIVECDLEIVDRFFSVKSRAELTDIYQ
ncbi:Replication factor A protein 3 [Entamoeba marina]